MEKNLTSAEELRTIRKIMEESTKFLSFSGLAGIFPGLFAIAGALIAYFLILDSGNIRFFEGTVGLALINAGKFTYNEVFYLGILQIITLLVFAFFPAHGLLFRILGFGILHIVYGSYMYRKYE